MSADKIEGVAASIHKARCAGFSMTPQAACYALILPAPSAASAAIEAAVARIQS